MKTLASISSLFAGVVLSKSAVLAQAGTYQIIDLATMGGSTSGARAINVYVQLTRGIFRRLALAVMLSTLSSASAYAGWEFQGANEALGVYTDAASVHEVQGKRRIKMLHDFKLPQNDRAGFQYQSTVFFIEFNCSGNDLIVFSTLKFSGHLASGRVVNVSSGSPLLTDTLRPSSAESAAQKVACSARPGSSPQGQDVAFWSGGGGQLAHAPSAGGRSPAPQKQSEMDFFRDLGMGKPNAVNVAPSQTGGNSPFSNADIANACDSQIKNMEIGYRGGMDVYQVDVLPPVKPAQSGLPAMSIPQTDLMYPAKVYVHFQNGGGRRYMQVYLYKSPFGTKCMSAP